MGRWLIERTSLYTGGLSFRIGHTIPDSLTAHVGSLYIPQNARLSPLLF